MSMLAIEHQKILKEVPLLKGLDEKQFCQIIKGTSALFLQNRETLFRQHQAATDFFYVVKGKIKISLLSIDGAEKVVDIINEGSTFAEAIILRGLDGYPVNSETIGDSVVLKISADRYINVLSQSTEACFKIIGNLSSRTHWLMNEVERLCLHNASYRLISYLLEQTTDSTNESVEITLNAAKHVIASRLSITPETLSRTLKSLCKKGLIEVHENHITLKKTDVLRQMISL